MIEETVKQTRCTTCDAEHPYKGGQAPRRKKKETAGALYREVLAGKPDDDIEHAVLAPGDAPAGTQIVFDLRDKSNIILSIKTLEGTMVASRGDYLIRGIKGEFYPCKPEIFEETYEGPIFERRDEWDMDT